MSKETKRKIARILSLAVIMAAILVVLGWVFDIGVLKSIRPTWISMKFPTAVTFILSGVSLYFIVRAMEGDFDKAQVVLSVTSFLIILLMGIFFFSSLLNIHTGAEDLFIKESAGTAKTVTPGRPSFPTTLSFLLIGSAGILTLVNPRRLHSKLRLIGLVVASIAAVALLGYLFNVPLLYFFLEEVNSAMACNTAILFVLLGTGLCLSE